MPKIHFWKVQSIGNDFVLIHHGDLPEAQLSAFAEATSARRFGIGSDGLLVVGKGSDGVLDLRMFNPDGTEDFCGNGIRCAFDHAIRLGWVDPSSMAMRHFGQEITGVAQEQEGRWRIEYQLPPASYRPGDIPTSTQRELFDTEVLTLDGTPYRGSVLSTGTAHTILPVDRLPEDDHFFDVSPRIEHHPLFPERTSVIWVQEQEQNVLRLRIWERGASETLGCGTGSAAAAVDYLRRKSATGSVTVINPGGVLQVDLDSWQSPIRLIGTTEQVYEGDFQFSA